MVAVHRTMDLLVDALHQGDILTIITYESEAKIVCNAYVVGSDRSELHTMIHGIVSEGGTNLEAGLIALSNVAKTSASPIDSVFLLTDGHFNQGITAGTGLLRILQSAIPVGTPVHTLGYGDDHNNRILRDMAMRSRGTYTFADTAELLPAIIGDISAGLASEIGRNGVLQIPDGWKCMEYGANAEDREFSIGTLIGEKEQWILLEKTGADAVIPSTIYFQWSTGAVTCNVGSDIPEIEIAEQMERVRVANVFATVSEKLDDLQSTEALELLKSLRTTLEQSIAKDRLFVIRLLAQVDEMIEYMGNTHSGPSPLHTPVRGLPRLHTGILPSNNMMPMLNRLASNTAALGNQRGFFSMMHSAPTATATTPQLPTVAHTFSSPAQRRVTERLTQEFSQQ